MKQSKKRYWYKQSNKINACCNLLSGYNCRKTKNYKNKRTNVNNNCENNGNNSDDDNENYK